MDRPNNSEYSAGNAEWPLAEMLHELIDRPRATSGLAERILAHIAKLPMTEETSNETWINSLGMPFVLIPAGSFLMGSPETDQDAYLNERPQHKVNINQPFYLSKYPVTQIQWINIMNYNPSTFIDDLNNPVENVPWYEIQKFIDRLNEIDKRSEYYLPTEAQWEYACRAGTNEPWYHNDLDAIAWYQKNSGNRTHPVGEKLPNAWGVYDMLGNVWEWCRDGPRTYQDNPECDPEGPIKRNIHVLGGGCWERDDRFIRAAQRFGYGADTFYRGIGFRLVRSEVSSIQ